LAHPLTLIAGILSAPLTTLNPLIGVGMITALMEAWLRKPTVADCEGVPDAILSVRGWYQNRATRVLLVFILSSIGASIGMLIGTTWVISLLR
jgi:pheromone shutdown protein TraB